MEQAGLLITIISISIFLSLLSIAHIIRRAIISFSSFIHLNCLFGSLIILSLNILDLLRVLKVIELSKSFSSIYFLCTSLTTILSCYIILQVGINFYQDYTFLKTLLMFAPIVVSMGVFVLSVFTAIRMILNESFIETEVEIKFKNIIFILSSISVFLSLAYGIFPLFSIKYQTRLRPQQTAISIVHFFFVVTLFIAHFVIFAVVTFKGSILEISFNNSIQNMILILIFPGCLFAPPRGIVKFIKRRMLGVEELAIGGDYRPNMLQPDNYTSRSASPSAPLDLNTQSSTPTSSISSSAIPPSSSSSSSSSSKRKKYWLSKSLPPLPPPISTITTTKNPISVISSPNPSPSRSALPNSTSPKQRESPLIIGKNVIYHNRSRSHYQPRSQFRPQFHKRSNTTNTNTVDSFNSLESEGSDTSFYISKFFNYNLSSSSNINSRTIRGINSNNTTSSNIGSSSNGSVIRE